MKSKKEFDFSEASFSRFATIQREINEKYTDCNFSLSDLADGLLDNLENWKQHPVEFFEWLSDYRNKNKDAPHVHKVLLLCEDEGKVLGKIKKELNAKRPEGIELVTTSEILEFGLDMFGEKVLSVFRGY